MRIFRHKQVVTQLKQAEVDAKILPVLNWINSYDGLFTVFSCEGRAKRKWSPYVIYIDYSNFKNRSENDEITEMIENFCSAYPNNPNNPNTTKNKPKLKKDFWDNFYPNNKKITKSIRNGSESFDEFEIRFENKKVLENFIKFIELEQNSLFEKEAV